MRIRQVFTSSRCCCCCWYHPFNKKLFITRNSTHYKELVTVLVRNYLTMKRFSYILTYIKLYQTRFYTFLFNFLLLIIICVISLWDSAPTYSPPRKELKSSSQKDACFSWHCTLSYQFHFILRHLSLRRSTSLITP